MPSRSCLVFSALLLMVPGVALAAPNLVSPVPVAAAEATRLEARTYALFDARAQELGLANGAWDVEVTRMHQNPATGERHVRVQQYVEDVPVFEGEAIVHFDARGRLRSFTDSIHRDVDPTLDLEPAVDVDEAIDIALAEAGLLPIAVEDFDAELYVARLEDGDHLAWKVRLQTDTARDEALGTVPMAPLMFVDALTGEVLTGWEDLHTSSASVTGTSTYYGSMTLDGSISGTTYYLEDVNRDVGVQDCKRRTSCSSRFSDSDGNFSSSSQYDGVDALYAMQGTWDFYYYTYGRSGINGSGGPTNMSAADGSGGLITAKARYNRNYNNAFWSSSYLVLGEGDGRNYDSFGSIDIVAHEMTHGVTQYEANLTYRNESGALNEATSDIFGAMTEYYLLGASGDWKIGEDTYIAGDAIRYMDNPHNANNYGYTADDDPDHYSERYTGSADSGGVHINSGIANHFFYLLSEGGTHHLGGTVTGIGRDAAAEIWYSALCDYMTSSTNFSGAKTATLNAAAALYGSSSTEYSAVSQAWSAVGV